MKKDTQTYLLKLSRKTIVEFIKGKQTYTPSSLDIPKEALGEKATFVTLTQSNNLRGCIGKILPVQSIYKDVIENSLGAAFEDSRFPPLKENELNKTKIEISVLSKPQTLNYPNSDQLIEHMRENHPGVIISKGISSATFLPQVWKELPDPSTFLKYLCLKAGLHENEWLQNTLLIQTYNVESFKEA